MPRIVGPMAIIAALGAALLYGLGSVLQQRSAALVGAEQSLKVSLVARLARRPQWLGGIACDLGGYALQFVALALGELVLVQPVLVSSLLFALPLGAAMNHRGLTGREWAGALLVVGGLSSFLVAASPAPGVARASAAAWAVTLPATLVPAGVLVALASKSSGGARAALLGAAAGISYGLTASLTKGVAGAFDGGLVQGFISWELYVLVVVGLATLVVGQSAFQAGPLSASLPVVSVAEPVVGILIGAFAYGEALAAGWAARAFEVLGLAAMAGGIVLLTRAPAAASRPGQAAAGRATR